VDASIRLGTGWAGGDRTDVQFVDPILFGLGCGGGCVLVVTQMAKLFDVANLAV